nr:transcriptional regulator [Desulfobacterales bacterium]
MDMLLLVYDVDFDEDVMETLSGCSITGYTKWERVLGMGERSAPKMNDAVWPGFNCAVMIAADEEKVPVLFDALKALHQKVGGKGLRVFTWPVMKII